MDLQRKMSFLAAAEELTANPSYLEDGDFIYQTCAKYGIFLDCITEDELKWLSALIADYM